MHLFRAPIAERASMELTNSRVGALKATQESNAKRVRDIPYVLQGRVFLFFSIL